MRFPIVTFRHRKRVLDKLRVFYRAHHMALAIFKIHDVKGAIIPRNEAIKSAKHFFMDEGGVYPLFKRDKATKGLVDRSDFIRSLLAKGNHFIGHGKIIWQGLSAQ